MAATIIVDTHKFVKRLTDAGMPTEQAEALSEQFTDNTAQLVTKKDLELAISGLKIWILGANGVIGLLVVALKVFG